MASTCARWRKSLSTSCLRRRTSRASCARTRTTWASTGSCTSTSSTRATCAASSRTRRSSGSTGRGSRRPSRGGAFQNKGVLLTVAVIVVLTMFVFAAFRWGGSDKQPELPPLTNTPQTKKAAKKPVAKLVAAGINGGAYVAVYRGARTGRADLRGHARERQETALRGPPPLGLRLRARQPPAQAERPCSPGAGSGDRVPAVARSHAHARQARTAGLTLRAARMFLGTNRPVISDACTGKARAC